MSKTLVNLRAAVRTWIAEESPKHFSNAAVTLALNTIARMVHAEVAALPDTGYLETVLDTVNLVADTAEYNIPATTLRLSSVQVLDDDEYVPLTPLTETSRMRGEDTITSSQQLPGWYILHASTVILRPTPNSALANGLRFVGVAEYTDMSGDGNTTGLPALCDAAIEFGAAALLLQSEGEELAAGYQAQHQGHLSRTLSLLSRRDSAAQEMTYISDDGTPE